MSGTKAKVCCAMPCRTTPDWRAFRSLQKAAAAYGAPFDTPKGEPRERNRNMCVRQFLSHGDKFTHLLFVDDDTIVPTDCIDMLLTADVPIACGVQPLLLPHDDIDHLVYNVMRFGTQESTKPVWPDWLTWNPPVGPFEIQYAGFGCVLIRREVLDQMGFPWFREDYGNQNGEWNITEDIFFCDKARRAGFTVYGVADVVCGHVKPVDLRDIVPIQRVDPRQGRPRAYRYIPGWLAAQAEALFRARALCAVDGGTFVELGVCRGRSLCFMAEALRTAKKSVRLVGVDNFNPNGSSDNGAVKKHQEECLEGLARAGINGCFELAVGDSVLAADLFEDKSVDFLYVDADHEEGSVSHDLDAWLPKMKDGSVMAGDDYVAGFPGVIAAVNDHFGPHVKVRGPVWAVCIGKDMLNVDPWGGH